jgi:hypothetical protein
LCHLAASMTRVVFSDVFLESASMDLALQLLVWPRPRDARSCCRGRCCCCRTQHC